MATPTQGDGEVCGTAIETPMRALVRLTVRKDLHVTRPEFLAAPDPHAALRNGGAATRPTASGRTCRRGPGRRAPDDRLARARARPRAGEAYLLCSVAVDLRISEIVDMPNFIVTAHCPLSDLR